MNKLGLAIGLAGALFAGNAAAATLSCLSTDDDRWVTITYDGGPASCGPAGVTDDTPEGTYFGDLGYTLLDKDPGEGDDGLLGVTGVNGTSGSFSIDASVVDGLLVFKFGSGGDEPDWISFLLNGVTGGTWEVFKHASTTGGNQALSHASLYGSTSEVPVPGTLGLLGLGLAGLGLVRRRKDA